jgi:hypothetical protein
MPNTSAEVPHQHMDSPDELPSSTIKISMNEPSLQGVKQEDRTLVRNVIYVLHVCKHPERLCMSWSVTNARTGSGCEITGLLDPSKDFEIFKDDLDLIKQADPLRVQTISIRKTGDTSQIVIKVLARSEPIMLTELEVLTVQKKRKLVDGGR